MYIAGIVNNKQSLSVSLQIGRIVPPVKLRHAASINAVTSHLTDTFCNNNCLLRACVAVSEILIFISFVHAISNIFISIFFTIKYGVT